MSELLVTGSAGRIGRLLRPRLAGSGRTLRLLDAADQAAPAPGEAVRLIRADITDPVAVRDACAGVDAVLHLAGLAGEEPWERLLRVNLDDCARLVSACLTTELTGFHVLWGTSRNSRRWLSLAEGRRIGYEPRDDAETYPAVVDAPASAIDGLLGAHFCIQELGTPDH